MTLTFEEASRMFTYDPDSGAVVRKVARASNAPAGQVVGSRTENGYLQVMMGTGEGRKKIRLHRLIWLLHHGSWPAGEIDHINRDRADNRIANLREVTRQQNCFNQGRSKRNTSGVVGVCWDRGMGKWRARIWLDGRNNQLGHFDDINEAAKAYATAKERLHMIGPGQ